MFYENKYKVKYYHTTIYILVIDTINVTSSNKKLVIKTVTPLSASLNSTLCGSSCGRFMRKSTNLAWTLLFPNPNVGGQYIYVAVARQFWMWRQGTCEGIPVGLRVHPSSPLVLRTPTVSCNGGHCSCTYNFFLIYRRIAR